MSGTYNEAKVRLATGDLAWDDAGKTFTAIAVGPGYTFDPDHDISDVESEELTGVGTRAPVTNRNVSKNMTLNRAELHADDSTLPEIDAGSIGFIVVVEEGGTDRPVAYLSSDGEDTPFNLATNGANILIAWPGGRVARIE